MAALAIRIGQGLAVVAARDAGADLRHLHQAVPQPRAVDLHVGGQRHLVSPSGGDRARHESAVGVRTIALERPALFKPGLGIKAARRRKPCLAAGLRLRRVKPWLQRVVDQMVQHPAATVRSPRRSARTCIDLISAWLSSMRLTAPMPIGRAFLAHHEKPDAGRRQF